MKLYHAIELFDVYVVAETSESAREALLQWAVENQPNELVATEIKQSNRIRPEWKDKTPLVASDVTDADFAKLKGKTVSAVADMLYTGPTPKV